jgi:endonuclease/exonuclease/phosphatase family metal-dependent hydrolase
VKIKIATVNTFFDGVSVHDLKAASWLKLHAKVFLGNGKALTKYHIVNDRMHPLEQICQEHSPDIVVVNEVIDSAQGSRAIEFLKNNGYHGVDLDAPVEMTDDFRRGTLVASRHKSETVKIDVQRFPGGRFSALKIHEHHLIVIGVQGTPFNWLVRQHQIRVILSYLSKFKSEGYRIVVAGDFNMGIRNSSLELPDDVGHFTERSFPSPDFYENICNDDSLAANLMCSLLKVRKAPRSLDHILFSRNGLELKSSAVSETTSDHCALVAEFEMTELNSAE